MNILFLGSLPPPYGGIATHLSDLKEWWEISGQEFISVPVSSMKKIFRVFWTVLWKEIDLISAYHTYPEGLIAFIIKKVLGIPYALTVFGELHTGSRWFYRTVINNADVIMASSNYCASGVKRFSDREVTVVPYGIDLKYFTTAPYSKDFPLLFVGNVHKRFGLDVLIYALKILKDKGIERPLYIVGNGEEVETLTEQSKPLDVMFFPDVSRERLIHYYTHASILINPANSKLPCMGLSMKEAMACSIPVIGSDAGGISEAVVDGETGLLFKSGNAIDLADKIEYLLAHPRKAEQMGRAGRKRAEELFNRERTMRTIWNILHA